LLWQQVVFLAEASHLLHLEEAHPIKEERLTTRTEKRNSFFMAPIVHGVGPLVNLPSRIMVPGGGMPTE